MPHAYLQTPIGVLELVSTRRLLRRVRIVEAAGQEQSCPVLEQAKQELREYFPAAAGHLRFPAAIRRQAPFK